MPESPQRILMQLSQAFASASAGDLRAIFALLSLALALLALLSLLYQLRLFCWPRVDVELLRAESADFGHPEVIPNERDVRAKVRYRYRVNGQDYIGSRLSPWIMLGSGGGQLVIEKQLARLRNSSRLQAIHNPSRPQKSWLQPPGIGGMLITLTGVLGFAALGISILRSLG